MVEYLVILEQNAKPILIVLEDQRAMLSIVMDQVQEDRILCLEKDWKSKHSLCWNVFLIQWVSGIAIVLLLGKHLETEQMWMILWLCLTHLNLLI